MTYIAKPKVHHPALQKNAIGLTRRDYEGAITTLCAGCGHDSITAAIIQAFWELSIPPHKVAKLSGIGCSSKTPAYFLREAHGFNSVHGRMPAIVTGANAANRDLIYIGVSGDGDSLSIGLGQLCHAIRRNVNMLYVLENNGVYGLTKGQFSASADLGSHQQEGRGQHDGRHRRRAAGADARRHLRRAQLLGRQGAAGADPSRPAWRTRASPSSTSSRRASPSTITRARPRATPTRASTRSRSCRPTSCRRPTRSPPTTSRARVKSVMLHDGSWVKLRKVAEDYDPSDRDRAYAYIRERQKEREVVTGLLYLSPDSKDMHGAERDGGRAGVQPAVRDAVPRERRTAEAAGAFPLGRLVGAANLVIW